MSDKFVCELCKKVYGDNDAPCEHWCEKPVSKEPLKTEDNETKTDN